MPFIFDNYIARCTGLPEDGCNSQLNHVELIGYKLVSVKTNAPNMYTIDLINRKCFNLKEELASKEILQCSKNLITYLGRYLDKVTYKLFNKMD